MNDNRVGITLRVDPLLREQLYILSRRYKTSMNALVTELLMVAVQTFNEDKQNV